MCPRVKAVVPLRFSVTRGDMDGHGGERGTLSWGRLDGTILPSGIFATPTIGGRLERRKKVGVENEGTFAYHSKPQHGRVAIWRGLLVQGTCRSAPRDHPGIGAIISLIPSRNNDGI